MDGWTDINDAPKDGTLVKLCWDDEGVPSDASGPWKWFAEENNWPIQSSLGIWMTVNKSMAWSVDNPDGAPTHFQHMTQ
jgi:hypothetical protein